MALIGLQMLLGRRGVWIPALRGRHRFSAKRVRSLYKRCPPAADWLRRHLHPTWECVAGGSLSISLIAVILIVLGGSLPVLGAIPVVTPLAGIPVALFAIGILGREGVVVMTGSVLIVLLFGALWVLGDKIG